MVAVICGVIGLVVNTISCLCVKELPEEDSVAVEDTQKPKDDKIGFVESLKLLISNKYYILIVAIYIVYYFMSKLTDRLSYLFYETCTWKWFITWTVLNDEDVPCNNCTYFYSDSCKEDRKHAKG